MEEKTRPDGITILAILGFIFGALSLIIGLLSFAVAPVLANILASEYGAEAGLLAGSIIGIIATVYGVIVLATAWGLWTGKKWAWWLTVILNVLGVLGILTGNVVGAVISAVILWYMFKPHVKDYFGVEVNLST